MIKKSVNLKSYASQSKAKMIGNQFEMTLQVQQSDLDDLNHVNNVIYLKWVQDVAAAHWKAIAPPAFESEFLWVVLKHTIEYKKSAFLGDKILIRTWVETIEGVKSDRCVEILNSTTFDLVCLARTTWCLIDRQSQRPRRIGRDVELALKK